MQRNYTKCRENAIYIYIYHIVKWGQASVSSSSMAFVLNKGALLLQKQLQQQNNSWNKHIILAEIQYMNERITSLMELSLNSFFCITCVSKEGFHLSQILCVFCSLVSFVCKGILHTWSHVSSPNDHCMHILLFQQKKHISKKKHVAYCFFNPLIHYCVKVHRKLYWYRFQQIL